LAWTPEGFSLIGYSLGGGIAADFASYFPNLVKSLVLLAPAGLIRSNHIGWQSRLMYLLELPPGFVGWAIRRRLRAGANDSVKKDALKAPEAAIKEEIQGTPNESAEAVQLSKTRPLLTVAAAVKWQLDHHRGFVHSFVSSIQNSSIERTPERLIAWGRLGRRKDKVIIIAGAADPIIIPSERMCTVLLPVLANLCTCTALWIPHIQDDADHDISQLRPMPKR
jgi:pimeloyl-ACP methyl ester carboxylesterase